MKRTGIIFILGLLLASLSWAQNGDNPAFDSVTFPVFSLNPAPVPGASIALVGQPGQATWYFWASANYQLGSVVSYLGSVSNAPNTLSGSNYISIIPTGYPGGVLTVDILATTGPLAPVGACNCAIATGLTSGGTNFQSNTLSSYSVSILNPQAFNLRLTNEVTGTGAVSLVLRNAYTGALICIVSAGCGGGSGVPITTVAGLASVPGKTNGTIAVVTDGNSLTDCTTGGSATNVLCQYNGTSWYAIVSAGTPGGSDAQLQFNHLGAFAGIANVAPGSLLASTSTTSPPAPQVKLVVDMRDGVNGVAGVKCDGTTDDTAAFQNYFTYYGRYGAGATNQVQFQLPIGQCVISNEVVYEGANNLGMILSGTKGLGANIGTTILWNGPNFGTMMLILGCNGCWVENIDFTANLGNVGHGPNYGAQNALWFESSNTDTTISYNLSTLTRSGNVVTATTTSPTTITPGHNHIIKVAGSTGGMTSFNGTFQVLYTSSTSSISWIQHGANESASAGVGTVSSYKSAPSNNLKFSYLEFYAPEAVTSTISSISGTNPTAVTTSTSHFINNGDTVCLRSVTDTSYIGCYTADVTSSTTANLFVLPYTGLSPSGTASSGGTLITGSSGLRFAHRAPETMEVASIHGNDIFVQGDQLGGTANCIESDNGGNAKDFIWENILFNGCRYGFNGFISGNFNLLGYIASLYIPADTAPTLATIDFEHMAGQITITGTETEALNNRFFGGAGEIHLDGISYQAAAPTDDIVITWQGELTVNSSLFEDYRASNATPILSTGNSLLTSAGGDSLISHGNFYANVATGGSWSATGYLPVVSGGTPVFSGCPGTYCNVPVNVQSLGDRGSTVNSQDNQFPLNNVLSGSLVTANIEITLETGANATSSVNNSSPCLSWIGNFFTSSIVQDIWTGCNVLGTGTAPSSTLTFSHTGGTIAPTSVNVPALGINNNLGLYEDSSNTLDVGNGQPYDFSGTVQLGRINFAGISSTLSSWATNPTSVCAGTGSFCQTYPGVWGMVFSVNRAVTVTALGRKWNVDNTQNHEVTLWNNNNQVTPIADGTVLNSSSSDSFGVKWVSVTPVTLTPGNVYAIGVSESGTDTFTESYFLTPSVQPEFNVIAVAICNTCTAGSFVTQSSPLGQMLDTPSMQFTTEIPVSGITSLGPASLAIGNSTPGDFSGSLKLTHLNAVGDVTVNGAKITSTAGVPSANCNVGDFDTNTSASSASTVFYVCYPLNTWNAVTVP